MKPKTLEDLLTQVEKKESGCWEWVGYRDKHGYGWRYWEGRDWMTHRLVMKLLGHKLSRSIWVCHRCDNPPCCNPDHLFLGGPKENIDDKVSKGRQSKGAKHGMAKLTGAQVEEIRARYAAGGVTQKQLALEYGISDGQISYLVANKSYTDPSLSVSNFKDKLSYEKAKAIREEYALGKANQREIAEKYNVDKSSVSLIILNKTWKPKNA